MVNKLWNKKGLEWWHIIATLAVIGILWYSGIFSALMPIKQPANSIVDGVYDEELGKCFPPSGYSESTLYSCCFNRNKEQVSCSTGESMQAIYQGTPGIFYVMHGISVTNTGNADIDSAYIESADWAPSNTELDSAYSSVVGSSYAQVIPQGTSVSWSTSEIDLQSVGTGTYDLLLSIRAQAQGLADVVNTKSAQITVEAESVGFSIDVQLI